MKGYSTKYALTQGIQAVEINEAYGTPDSKYRYTKSIDGDLRRLQLVVDKPFFETKEAAEENAREQARRKVASLEKQLGWARPLTENPIWSES